MAFHFTLESVLRLRQSLEDRELLLLQTLLARRAALLSELEQYRLFSLRVREVTGQVMLTETMPAAEIHFAEARLNALERHQQRLRRQLGELETAITEQRYRFEQQRNFATTGCGNGDGNRHNWMSCTCCAGRA